MNRNIVTTEHLVRPAAREARNTHCGCVVWLTALPGAGKSTLSMRAERALFERGRQAYVLDGDNVRRGLSSDLGFPICTLPCSASSY
jgi:bifunctional enzyme CysN/CysC